MFPLNQLNTHFLTPTELSYKIWLTVKKKTDFTVWGKSMKELSQYALLTKKEKLEFLELVIDEKDVNYMNSKITYTDEPMELGQVVKDFLPPPDQLVPKGKTKTTQVTLELTEESVSFFKSQADRKQITQEKIIELLVKQYARECISDG